MANDVSLEAGGRELVDELEPVWMSLFRHHRSVGPGPFIPEEQSWPIRRAFYDRVLDNPQAFVLTARRSRRVVGYAVVAMHPGPDDTWPTGETFAEVETLAVLPEERGCGLGTALLDAVDERLRGMEVTCLFIGVMAGNDDALRFYERRGLRPVITKLMRIDSPPPT
jgi:ribosomal protein S18 acetylase RimI-like enzyme